VLGGLNPSLRVPTLLFEDGRSLGESGAILWYFGDGTRFVPEDPYERAQVLQWMFFEQYDLEPSIGSFASGSPTRAVRSNSPTGCPSEWKPGTRALAALDRHLDGRRYLVGDSYSLADIALYGYTHVASAGGFELEPYPAVRAWLDRVTAEPGHISIDA
jgi:glutathione S-transferase